MYVKVCKDLPDPPNGKVFIEGCTAYFVCLNGATLVGNHTIKCIDGVWIGSLPTCRVPYP